MKLHPEYNDNQMVVAYYRYSSSSQNEASIEQQRQMVQRWAKAQGLVVVSEYEEAAKTGTNADRPGYQLMLRELPKIKPAYARSGRTTVSHEIEPSYCSPSKRSAPSVLAFITSRGSPPQTPPTPYSRKGWQMRSPSTTRSSCRQHQARPALQR